MPSDQGPLRFLADMWPFMRPYRRDLLGAGVWTVGMQVLALVEPFLLMYIVNSIVGRGVTSVWLFLPYAAMAYLLMVLTTYFKVQKDRRTRAVTSQLEAQLPGNVLLKLLRLPLSYHHGTNAGQSISLVQDGTGRMREMVWFLFYDILPVMVQTAVVTITLALLHSWIAVIVLVTVTMAWVVLIRFKARTKELRQKRMDRRREQGRLFSEHATNVMTIQAFRKEGAASDAVKAVGEEHRRLHVLEFVSFDRWQLGRNSLINLGRVGIIVLCASLVFTHVLNVGQIIFITMLVERLFNANFQLSNTYDKLVEAVEPIKALLEITQQPETIRDPEQPQDIPSGPVALSLHGVSFAYSSEREKLALTSLNLEIASGTMVGIVGESGHGKSTLARLLGRFADPTTGALRINGVDYRDVRLDDLRKRIGYVPQEVELFNDTIRANILYGRPDATEAEVAYAAKLARADVFINRTSNGYNTLIGDRGLRLSGGERQRIGIARAILTGAPVLLFDEATSSVDADTIHEIKRAMAELRKERTLIVITHQLSTVQDADLIVVLKDGAISGMGTHSELVRSNDTYRGFVRLQQNAEASLLVQGDPRNIS